jgi:hypothetical protein
MWKTVFEFSLTIANRCTPWVYDSMDPASTTLFDTMHDHDDAPFTPLPHLPFIQHPRPVCGIRGSSQQGPVLSFQRGLTAAKPSSFLPPPAVHPV